MPFSILIFGYPATEALVAHVQGPAVQGMFLNLMREVDPAVNQRLHHDNKYRPYTVSPLGLGKPDSRFQGFRLPRDGRLRSETSCYIRMTFLEDDLFPTFSRYFLEKTEPTFWLGATDFVVSNVLVTQEDDNPWSAYISYAELIERASQYAAQHSKYRKITLKFLTPTSFRRGDVDFPLPDPRLVFGSYQRRFEEFYQVAFLPDFAEQVEFYTGIARLDHVHTSLIRTKKIPLAGFTGTVTYAIDKKAPPDLVFQMNLLADYAFFSGTGRKTTVGMGQTVRSG